MNSRADNQSASATTKLLQALNQVAKNIESKAISQTQAYLQARDSIFGSKDTNDVKRLADSVQLTFENDYRQCLLDHLAPIAADHSRRYTDCLGKISELMLSEPDIELNQKLIDQIAACEKKRHDIGDIDRILTGISTEEGSKK